jgi:hypothetical protein
MILPGSQASGLTLLGVPRASDGLEGRRFYVSRSQAKMRKLLLFEREKT